MLESNWYVESRFKAERCSELLPTALPVRLPMILLMLLLMLLPMLVPRLLDIGPRAGRCWAYGEGWYCLWGLWFSHARAGVGRKGDWGEGKE